MTDTGSSVPRRQLGRYLRKLREEAGMELEPAARELEWSRARQYRIERGEVSLRTHDVIAMCKLYDATEEMTEVLVGLARETKATGWWHAYGNVVPAWFELFVGLEAAATSFRRYEPALIPGLLQTPEYAEAIIRSEPNIGDAEVAQKVSLRMERQKLLARRAPRPPTLDVILDEGVLYKPIADQPAWLKQLAHLSNVSRPPAVSVRILPSEVGPHRISVAGAFVIMEFPTIGTRDAEPTTVYSESLTGALYLDKAVEVEAFLSAWKFLESLALDVRASQDRLAEIIRETSDE